MASAIVTVDIGATNLRVARFVDGSLHPPIRRDTPQDRGADGLVDTVVEIVRALAPIDAEIAGICVGVPAPVDSRTGLVREASNLPLLEGVPLSPLFQERLPGLCLFIRNDAMLATIGEYRFGAGCGSEDMLYVTVSTGIGGGVVIGGRIVTGVGGYAGELGEILVPDLADPSSSPVSIEEVASGAAIARAGDRAARECPASKLHEISKRENTRLTARLVAEAAREGDEVAASILMRAATYIGFGIVDVLHIVNPQRVVLGGGIMKSADLMMPTIRRTVETYAMEVSTNGIEILLGKLGDDAGLYGGVAVVLDSLEVAAKH